MRAFHFVLACAVVVIGGVWLRWPGVRSGFHGDDAVQLAMLRGEFTVPRSAFDLFRFADPVRDGSALVDFGYLPWWTVPEHRIAMFRPLSSALMAIDHALFGLDPVPYHLHSALWWCVLVTGVALLYARLFRLPVALLALALFALDPAHTVPFAWIANRNALVATALGAFALFLHVTPHPSRRSRVATSVLFTLALLGGEHAMSMVALAIAHDFITGERRPRPMLASLAPVLVPAVAVVAVRAVLGFGVRGSEFYLDAVESPVAFARVAALRAPVNAADEIFGIDAAWFTLGTPWRALESWRHLHVWRAWSVASGFLALAVLGAATRFAARRTDTREGRHLVWLAIGALGTLVLASAALPQDRVLVPTSIALAPLYAIIVALATERLNARRWLSPELPLALAVLFVHGALAARRSYEQIAQAPGGAAAQRRHAALAAIPDEGADRRRVLILTGPDFSTTALLPWVRLLQGHPLPHSYTRLSGSGHVHDLTRVAPNVLDMSVLSDDVDGSMAGSLYRPNSRPLRIGEQVQIAGLRATVLRTSRQNPWSVRYTFEKSLDDPDFVFLQSTERGLERLELPAVGETKRIASPRSPSR